MNWKIPILTLILVIGGTAGYYEFFGDSETYEGVTEMVPIVGDQEPENKMYVSYTGSEEYGDIQVTPEYLKLANSTTGDVQRTYDGVNETFSLSELDRTPVFSFPAFEEYDILVSFDVNDPQNRSLLYNELNQMRYRNSIDFGSRDSFNITVDVKGAETGDQLVYSPELDYQSPSRDFN